MLKTIMVATKHKILLDADVIRHFISGGMQYHLVKIFPNQLIIYSI
jgi:hypothetical protein